MASLNPLMAQGNIVSGLLAIALINAGRAEEAIDVVNHGIHVCPTYCELWRIRGIAHMWLRNYMQASEDLKKSLSIEPRVEGASEPLKVSSALVKAMMDS
jgi:Flp pilus assembly protein TadD